MTLNARPQTKEAWFTNALVPAALTEGFALGTSDAGSGLASLDFGITAEGRLTAERGTARAVDLQGRMVLPTFVDSHVHLDKAYIVARTGIPEGGLMEAVRLSTADAGNWTAADLRARMTRALTRAYHNGTSAMRTHLDTPVMPADSPAWQVFCEMRKDWAGRVDLQAVALMALERVEGPDFAERCQQIADRGGILGAFIAPNTATPERLDTLFICARAAGLDVDFHVDETLDPTANALELICDSILRSGFAGRVMAGHCCSLRSAAPADLARITEKVARSGVHVVSLPHTNLFLQDRASGRTPALRGITAARELAAAGASIHFASDNVQDPFYPYGDFDMFDSFRMAVRAAHLDSDIAAWALRQFRTAAKACGFDHHGRLKAGASADLILFDANNWTDLMSRPAQDRVVLRAGEPLPSQTFNLRDLFAMEPS
ncbi:cytosine deaminase [Pararhodobacter oceanensis]|uniref:cytosine deaminase n=1 Tax=Pararhodobacter oceanensis TaxID=2172121 RepID=UPI003A8CD8FB